MNFGNSKTKIALIKALIIQRLELQMTTVATRLKSKILEEIVEDIQNIDRCLTSLLKSSQTRFKKYRKPCAMNVANDCMRGQEIHELNQRCTWTSGPEFLFLP